MLDQAQLERRDDGVGAEHRGLVVERGVEHTLDQPPLVLPLRGVQVGGDADGQVAADMPSSSQASVRTSTSWRSGRPQATAERSRGSPAISRRRQPRSSTTRRSPSATASIR